MGKLSDIDFGIGMLETWCSDTFIGETDKSAKTNLKGKIQKREFNRKFRKMAKEHQFWVWTPDTDIRKSLGKPWLKVSPQTPEFVNSEVPYSQVMIFRNCDIKAGKIHNNGERISVKIQTDTAHGLQIFKDETYASQFLTTFTL